MTVLSEQRRLQLQRMMATCTRSEVEGFIDYDYATAELAEAGCELSEWTRDSIVAGLDEWLATVGGSR